MSDRVLYSISINDNIYFHGIVDVLNECFGKGYKACYKSFIPVDDTHQACITLCRMQRMNWIS